MRCCCRSRGEKGKEETSNQHRVTVLCSDTFSLRPPFVACVRPSASSNFLTHSMNINATDCQRCSGRSPIGFRKSYLYHHRVRGCRLKPRQDRYQMYRAQINPQQRHSKSGARSLSCLLRDDQKTFLKKDPNLVDITVREIQCFFETSRR
jgi:hypothetical protein